MSHHVLFETLFFTAHHIGLLDEATPFAASASSGKPGFGSVLILGLLGDEQAYLKCACFKAYGPPALIVAAEYLCRKIESQNLASLEPLNIDAIKNTLAIDNIYVPELVRLADVYHKALKKLTTQYPNML
jgi:nitrogen fixation NifU-like protein